jgi:hypothetical protein
MIDALDSKDHITAMRCGGNMGRLSLSRQVVEKWEAMGGPPRTVGNLQIVQQEIDILAGIARKNPEHQAEAHALSERYVAIASKIRAGLN